TSCSSGTEIWNGRMVLLSAAKAVRSSVSVKAAAVQAARRARRAGEDGSEDMILLPGCRSALGGDLDDRLGESLRRFLRQIVPDAALDRPVRVPAGEFLRISTWVGMRCAVRVSLERDARHGDDRSFGEPLLQIVIVRLAFG